MIKSISMRRRKAEELSLNLTPLIDVVFLLLIFFMVTTNFKTIDQLGVELPQTRTQHGSEVIQGVQLNISHLGEYMIGDELIAKDLSHLKSSLVSNFESLEGKNKLLYILGDRMAPHQSVVSAMDVAQKIGITRIKIVTEQIKQ